ncbi:MAG: hypothetical protein M5T61_20380 [Acidimicrobiia bacterium]|nr:hypothetical protein [Acidimicrobiia bacterium]
MANYGKTGPVHQVTYNPETGRNDIYFGPAGEKAGHVVTQEHEVHFVRGAGQNVTPSYNSGKSVPK